MKATEMVKVSLNESRAWMLALALDMKDAPTTFPTAKGGNHPLWNLGHVIYAEAAIVSCFIQGKANPLSKWESLFGLGSEPVADAGTYPSFDELLSALETTRAATLEVLNGLTDEDLSKPSQAPEERKAIFGTIGQCFVMLTHHWTFHAGQVADARRAVGRRPLLA